jgi:transcriptional regulator with XRE-family HTH domain
LEVIFWGYGDTIRNSRKKANLSQIELAEKISVSRSAIYAWEKEKFPPTDAKNIAALESALEIEPGKLYKIIYSNPPQTSEGAPESPGADRRTA